MKKAITYFLASALFTAIFSYSLNAFLKESLTVLTLKTMLIPCFTWSILLISAYFLLPEEKKTAYFVLAGMVCMIGSAVLVPAGIYNFITAAPVIEISVVSVFMCVLLMSFFFYIFLKKAEISLNWWLAFNVLIFINMTLFYLAVKYGW